jgi:NAD-dependent SIR2 family protein deacetylase
VVDLETMRAAGTFPRCGQCGALARPNVLLFGDDTWVSARAAAQRAHYQNWLQSLGGARLVVLELGAGTAIPTVRSEGRAVAARHRGTLIRVNPREFALDWRGGISLPGTALEVLEALSAML